MSTWTPFLALSAALVFIAVYFILAAAIIISYNTMQHNMYCNTIQYKSTIPYNTGQDNMTGQFDAAYHCPLDAIFPFQNILERSLVTKKVGTNVVLQSEPSRIHVVRC